MSIGESTQLEAFRPIVYGIASQYRRISETVFWVDHDDMIQEAWIAALLALRSHDPVKGVPPKAWVRFKVGKRMLDVMRKCDDQASHARALGKAIPIKRVTDSDWDGSKRLSYVSRQRNEHHQRKYKIKLSLFCW